MRELVMSMTAAAVLLSSGGGALASDADAAAQEAWILSDVRQFTFEGKRAGEGYFSADGQRMVFQSEREAGNPFYQMYVMDLETGDVEKVSSGAGKTTCGWLHPDGKRTLFASTHEDPDARVKQKSELDFRAAGKKRRYSWDYDETYELYEHDPDTGALTNLTKAKGYDAEGAYSPDGSLIVFASNRDAYARDLTEAEEKIFKKDKSYFMDVYVMKADGSGVRRLTESPGYDGGTFFSADGKRIVWRRFSEDGTKAEVWSMNVDGSDQRQITWLGVMSWAPYYHPSGDYIVFATNKHGYGNFELYIVDSEGKREPVRVTFTDGFDGLPAFSPDGTKISWTSNRTAGGTSQIFLANWNDAEARRLLRLGDAAKGGAVHSGAGIDVSETAPGITVADLKRHVGTLASEAMEGRLTGTPGEQRATQYVADVFAALGLAPAGEDGSWFQPFTFTAGISLGDDNQIAIEGADGVPTQKLDKTWRPLAFSRTGETGPWGIAFAGYGIVAPADNGQEAYDSYAGLDAKDKWVLVYRGLPQDVKPKRRQHLTRYSELQYKASEARRHGAKGLIVASPPHVPYVDPLVRLTYDAAGGVSSIAAISIDTLTAEALLAKAGRDLDGLRTRLDAGEPVQGFTLPKTTAAATIHLIREAKTGRNVLARLKTGAPADAPAIMVGAHVDHLGRGETSGSLALDAERGQVHFGADDNASGVAAMLEIAQDLLAKHKAGKLKAKRDILFAAWSGEELGLLGSSHYVGEVARETGEKGANSRIAAYLNMDMVGRLRDKLNLFGTASSSVWTREIERRNVPVGLAIASKGDSYLPTDATPFYLKGVPVLHAFTGTHSEYSTPRDTADTVNYEGLEKIARLMGGIARSQARAATAPDYKEQPAPKGEGGRKRATVYLGTIPDYAQEGVKGVRISGVAKNGPAAKAGLKGGDVIVRLANTDIENIYDFVNVMNGLAIGKGEALEVERDGSRLKLEIVPAARE